ncbi:putative tyrosine/serine protein phosphatase, partial [Cladorrhinum samala]
VREGVLFRSARLDDASLEDQERLRNEYGIRTVLDLRTKTEHLKSAQARPPNSPPARIPGATYLSVKVTSRRFEFFLLRQLPFLGILYFLCLFVILSRRIPALRLLGQQVMAPRGLLRLGLDTLDCSQPEIASCLRALLSGPGPGPSPPLPILVHCTQGKDRTGLIVILALLILNVPEPAVSHDYHLTDQELLPDREDRLAEIREIGLPDSFAETSPELVRHVVDYLEANYGGLEAYLDKIGFGEMHRNQLRESMLY